MPVVVPELIARGRSTRGSAAICRTDVTRFRFPFQARQTQTDKRGGRQVCKDLGDGCRVTGPGFNDSWIMALQRQVYCDRGSRGRETKEAIRTPITIVKALERFVVAGQHGRQGHEIFLAGEFPWIFAVRRRHHAHP